jgi:hypothetical protein
LKGIDFMRRRNDVRRAVAIVAGCGLLWAIGLVATAKEPVELFNGKDFRGWKVLGCEAEVRDGAILLKAGNGMVQTERQYGDFLLELDWKNLKADHFDSGVFFRYTSIPAKRPWPLSYQSNLRQGDEGNVAGLPGAKSIGLTKPGEWNHFKLTVRGTTAALELNGKPAWKADGLQVPRGYIGLQSEVPGGGQYLFRNIRLTELDKTPK